MAILQPSERLRKDLSLLNVFAISVGATLSSGFFLLPGLAARVAGPAVILAYLVALLPLVPGIMSKVELATAMPRAGGVYYFLDRAVGPLFGTIAGIGTWLALVLKVAFALVGMGAYLHLFWHEAPVKLLAIAFAVVFGVVNFFGAKRTGGAQVLMVAGLLLVLGFFIIAGVPEIRWSEFHGFFERGPRAILATAGLVCVSYIGLTKVASIAEEVREPERTLPLGMLLAVLTAIGIYIVGTTVMVGVLGERLYSEKNVLTPVAATAEAIVGHSGAVLLTIAAILAFFSVANAGILSASRYPLAMSRDQLMPSVFQRLGRFGTPTNAIVVSVAMIVVIIALFRPLQIAKLAGAFQLLLFAGNCVAVIVMRASRIESYDPGYRSPLFPWLHIFGIIAPFVLIIGMGWLAIVFSLGLMGVGAVWFYAYGRSRAARHGAIYHVFDHLAQRRFYDLDRELRSILKEKGLRREDPFDEVVACSGVVDLEEAETFAEVAERAASILAERVPRDAPSLARGFLEGTQTGATPVSGGIALPHMRVAGVDAPEMVIARVRAGVHVGVGDAMEAASSDHTYAVFFLISPEHDPGRHLRILAQLASRVDEENFLERWLEAEDEQALKGLLFRDERFVQLDIEHARATRTLVGRAVRDVDWPGGCLVALVRRDEETFVPRGGTILREHDCLTVLGEAPALNQLRRRFDLENGP